MAEMTTTKRYIARHVDEVEPVRSVCGSSTRVLTGKDTQVASLHITHIKDSQKHYHKRITEIYYILEGSGALEVGDEEVQLTPGMTVLIEPGLPHRGKGDFKAAIVSVPPFSEDDSYHE